MEHTAHLWLFFVMVFGVVLLPGLDMAYVMASALVGGRRDGLLATAGVIAGGVCHVAMGALGIMAVLRLVPAAFNGVLLGGALYIAWIGVSLLRSRAAFGAPAPQSRKPPLATFRQGMLTCLLNPKAYLFMLAVFPQFIQPEYGPLWLQALVMGGIIAATQAGVYGGMALAGDRVRGWLAARPGADVLLARSVGGLLVATAVFTAYEGWRGL
ncbi:LysE family translocator [Luteimonas aquatica]|uniref:LysE family translocator n=1 Tax=Luteimonas aquatica TaxID=450364 RepID=UPI001F59EBF8|nr:LysE family translocator [Luteimonas aquatica]